MNAINNKKVYVVLTGRKPGIYTSKKEAKKQTSGFPGAKKVEFNSRKEALESLGIKEELVTEELELKQTIKMSKRDIANIYVDGSHDPGSNICAFSYVVVKDGEVTHYSSDLVEYNIDSHNINSNIAETQAVKYAIEYLIEKGETDAIFYYDSLTIKNVFKNGAKSQNPIYTKLGLEILELVKKHNLNINLTKVKAHNGNPFNNYADFLARSEMRIKRDGLYFFKERHGLPLEIIFWLKDKIMQNLNTVVYLNWKNDPKYNFSDEELEKIKKEFIARCEKRDKIHLSDNEASDIINKNIRKAINSSLRSKGYGTDGYFFLESEVDKSITKKEYFDLKSQIQQAAMKAYIELRLSLGFEVDEEFFLEEFFEYFKQNIKSRYPIKIEDAAEILDANENKFLKQYRKRKKKEKDSLPRFISQVRKLENEYGFEIFAEGPESLAKLRLKYKNGPPMKLESFDSFDDI